MSWRDLAWLTGLLNFFKAVWYSFAEYMRKKYLRDEKRDDLKEKTPKTIKGGSASDMLNQWQDLEELEDK